MWNRDNIRNLDNAHNWLGSHILSLIDSIGQRLGLGINMLPLERYDAQSEFIKEASLHMKQRGYFSIYPGTVRTIM